MEGKETAQKAGTFFGYPRYATYQASHGQQHLTYGYLGRSVRIHAGPSRLVAMNPHLELPIEFTTIPDRRRREGLKKKAGTRNPVPSRVVNPNRFHSVSPSGSVPLVSFAVPVFSWQKRTGWLSEPRLPFPSMAIPRTAQSVWIRSHFGPPNFPVLSQYKKKVARGVEKRDNQPTVTLGERRWGEVGEEERRSKPRAARYCGALQQRGPASDALL